MRMNRMPNHEKAITTELMTWMVLPTIIRQKSKKRKNGDSAAERWQNLKAKTELIHTMARVTAALTRKAGLVIARQRSRKWTMLMADQQK